MTKIVKSKKITPQAVARIIADEFKASQLSKQHRPMTAVRNSTQVLLTRITSVIPCVMGKVLRAVRINERDMKRLERLAKKEAETVSALIQRAVREFLDRQKA